MFLGKIFSYFFKRCLPDCSVTGRLSRSDRRYTLAEDCVPRDFDCGELIISLHFQISEHQHKQKQVWVHFEVLFFIRSEGLSLWLGGKPWCTGMSNLWCMASLSQSSHTERNLPGSVWIQGCMVFSWGTMSVSCACFALRGWFSHVKLGPEMRSERVGLLIKMLTMRNGKLRARRYTKPRESRPLSGWGRPIVRLPWTLWHNDLTSRRKIHIWSSRTPWKGKARRRCNDDGCQNLRSVQSKSSADQSEPHKSCTRGNGVILKASL